MTTSVNPMVHLQHAWDNTNSMWGKWTIVLFYLFLWLNILLYLAWLVWPQWMGLSCYWENESEYAAMSMEYLVRARGLFLVGFLFYADRGGIRFWNVSMVTLFSLLYSYIMWTWDKHWAAMDGAPKHCGEDGLSTSTWVLTCTIWILLAWIFSYMEHRAGHGGDSSGTTNESTPLRA